MPATPEKDTRRLYGDLAWTWPIISPVEDYVEESELFSKIIKEHALIYVKTVLHLGCGGGHIDYTLKKYFKITGIDISEEMLKLARKLNPEVNYNYGDMRIVRLNRLFDAVAIPDSINYMKTEEELYNTFLTAYEHLKPGGILLTIAEEITEKFKQNYTHVTTHSQGNIEVVLIENHFDADPNDTIFEVTFIYLIRRCGELEIYTDRHVCGIFKLETWHELLKEVGFEVKQMKFEHSTFAKGEYLPMFVCTKPL